MLRRSIGLASVCALAGTAGCATIVEGSTQALDIRSQPDGAKCGLMREGAPIGEVTTPGTVTIKRSAKAITVTCAKEGFEEARGVMNAQVNRLTYGNAIIGGFIGSAIDNSSGANFRYEPSLSLTLSPMSAADIAAAATRPKTPTAGTAPSPMLTGPWKANSTRVEDKSAQSCPRNGGAYSLDLANDQLTVDTVNGRMFTAPIPADGSISHSFTSPTGARLELVGNARTRELEIVNAKAACRWKLTPEGGEASPTPTQIECVGDDGTRLRVTATACPPPLRRAS